jgi:hypothetical protein
MESYKMKRNKRQGRCPVCAGLKRPRLSSKTDAFLDGVGTLLEIFPDPRRRTIRAFICHHHASHASSVGEAIWDDWASIGQDMWTAFEVHEHEESPEEVATRAESFSTQ